MRHVTVLLTFNLVHKQLMCYICHMPQNIYCITQCRSHIESTEIIPGFRGWHGPHTPNP